jgi:hypothetical protein
MENNSLQTLKNMIDERKKREGMQGQEVFAAWGLLNILVLLLYQFVWHSPLIWVIMIGTGIFFQIFYTKRRKIKKGYVIFWNHAISQIWISIVISLPLLFFIFPHILHLYGKVAIFPLLQLILFFGMYVTGIISKERIFKWAGIVFLFTSILSGVWPDLAKIFYGGAMLLGFILPAIGSRYAGRK